MINTSYSVGQFHKLGNRNFSQKVYANTEKFSLEAVKEKVLSSNLDLSINVEDVISNLEQGDKSAINILENLGLNYSLTEYKDGYKIKFEYDGNKYTVAYNGESVKTEPQPIKTENEVIEAAEEGYDATSQLETLTPPKAPQPTDYVKEVTYSNGMKETLVDEDAYEAALQEYFSQKVEYEKQIYEINQKTAEEQRQDIISNMQKEQNSFNQSIEELQAELDATGTNSKMATSIINELSTEYSKLLQKKTDEEIKGIDFLLNYTAMTVPRAPVSSSYETDEEYAEAMNTYTYQKFLYDKQQKELELRMKYSEKRIKKLDEKLAQIKRLLFGNITT